MMQKIGLVGGISWVSTIDYYTYLNEEINKKLGGLNFAECVIYSLNFNDIQSVGWDNSYALLLNACENLKKSEVSVIVLCANIAHIFADRLEREIQIPIVNIAAETASKINSVGLKKVGLLGTIYTMEMDFFKDKLFESGIEVLIPESKEIRNYIQYTLKEELGRGILNAETKLKYLEIIRELIKNGAEGIVLGCTEIPMIIGAEDVSAPVFNTLKIHVDAAIDTII